MIRESFNLKPYLSTVCHEQLNFYFRLHCDCILVTNLEAKEVAKITHILCNLELYDYRTYL